MILGGVLVVLIIFAYIQQGPWQDWKENVGKPDNFLASLDYDLAERIDIAGSVSLEREGEYWKVGGTKDFYVKSLATDKLREAFKEIAEGELEIVSKNKDNKSDFGADENGALIKVIQSDGEYEFIIGNTGPTVATCYISRSDDDKTYLLNANVRTSFIRDDWRDNQIFSFLPERVKKLRFQYPNKEFSVEKVENVWKSASPSDFEVNEEKITEILEAMGNLSAVDIPEQTFEGTGLEKHSLIVEATDNMDSYTIMIGDANEAGQYYSKRGSSDNIYLISEEDKNLFDKNISDLK